MRPRSLMALSLMALALLPGLASPPVAPAQTQDAALEEPGAIKELAISPDEEREARELVERFNRRFQETNDIAPLIADYFVSDFAARLRQHADTMPFVLIDWKDETRQPDPHDLQRFYAATTDLWNLFFRYAAARHKGRAEEDETDPRLEELLPPEAVELLMSDPTMRAMWGSDEKEGSREAVPENDSLTAEGKDAAEAARKEEHLVEDAEELRAFTLLNEKLSKILKDHLVAHPLGQAGTGKPPEDADDEGEDDFDVDKVEISENARIIDDEFYGYPRGTRLICARAGVFHVEMVRVEGRLRILSVYLLVED